MIRFPRHARSAPLVGLCLLGFLARSGSAPVRAQATEIKPGMRASRYVGFDRKPHAQIPLDLMFRDETGQAVQLGKYFGKRPVLLNLIFYKCAGSCTLELHAMAGSFKAMDFSIGKEFDVVTVSINPKETPKLALAKKKDYLELYGRAGADRGWHFLTGEQAAIQHLAEAVGFRYAYDLQKERFDHTTGLVVASARGRASHYLFGLDYAPWDLRLALIESSAGSLGSVADKVRLAFSTYDPVSGRYALAPVKVLFIAGLTLLLLLGIAAFQIRAIVRRERRGSSEASAESGMRALETKTGGRR